MYDLTTFLATVASVSASIVAILGGLIASKLITINGDREANATKIDEIEQLQKHKQSELLKLKQEVVEEESIDFINAHIMELLSNIELKKVYVDSEKQFVSYSDLVPYWQRAIEIWQETVAFIKDNAIDTQTNSDKIPSLLAQKYTKNNFDYEICSKIFRALRRIKKKEEHKNSILGIPSAFEIDDMDFNISNPIEKNSINTRISNLESELRLIKLQRTQLLDERNKLQRPKGMKIGLIIFAFFSVTSIVFPLLMCPWYVDNQLQFWIFKGIVLGLFLGGIGSILGYLLYWLKD